MKKLKFAKLLVVTAFLSGATAVHADILSGIAWAAGQANVTCYLFNAGPGTVSITSNNIFNEAGGTALTSTSCGTTLAAGATCWIGASVPGTGAHACRSVISPSGDNVRGEIEIRNSGSVILNSAPLR
jgi:hypothetical protein